MPDQPTEQPKLPEKQIAEKLPLKTEKAEKFEHKEKPEKLEHKELEKQLLEVNPKDIAEGPQDPGNINERVAALEQSVASLHHFITSEQRPDLSRGALSSEPGAKKPGG